MSKLFNSSLFKISLTLLTLGVIAKGVSVGAWYYLDCDGVELSTTPSYQPEYHRIDFRSMIEKEKKVRKEKKKVIKKKITNAQSITNMVLKGLYGKGKKGFAIVALKSSAKKTSIVSVGESFSGYTLSSIEQESVVFMRNSKEYTLELKNAKVHNKQTARVKKYKKTSTQITQQEVIDDDTPRDVQRSDIEYFAKHPREIWRNISIHEVKKNNKIIGFKVRKINKNSVFSKLGLKKGDLIVKANNITLNSYKNAIDIYNKIDTISTMQIVVIRDNQEKELVYEIN